MQIGISFEPDLIGVMSQFSGFDAILKKHIAIATEKSAGKIGDFQVQYMWSEFQNPTGPLEDSVSVRMVTEYLAWIGPDPGDPASAYAWRRDRGYVGQYDVLGRGPYSDLGIRYAEASILDVDTLMFVSECYIEAVHNAWAETMGRIPPGAGALVNYSG